MQNCLQIFVNFFWTCSGYFAIYGRFLKTCFIRFWIRLVITITVHFVQNLCKTFGVFPKLINVYIHWMLTKKMYGIKKKLRKNAIRINGITIKYKLNNFDWYILVGLIKRNIKNKENSVLKSQQKKIKNLTNNWTNMFTHRELVKNLSSKQLTNEELDLLKFSLHHSLPSSRIYKTNIFVSFKMIPNVERQPNVKFTMGTEVNKGIPFFECCYW